MKKKLTREQYKTKLLKLLKGHDPYYAESYTEALYGKKKKKAQKKGEKKSKKTANRSNVARTTNLSSK